MICTVTVNVFNQKKEQKTNLSSAVESGYCSATGVKSWQSRIPVGTDEGNKSQVVTKSFIWNDCFEFMSYKHCQNPAICLWDSLLSLNALSCIFMSFYPSEKCKINWIVIQIVLRLISLILMPFAADYLQVVAFDVGQTFLGAASLFLHQYSWSPGLL